jgi:hypothetical protein
MAMQMQHGPPAPPPPPPAAQNAHFVPSRQIVVMNEAVWMQIGMAHQISTAMVLLSNPFNHRELL